MSWKKWLVLATLVLGVGGGVWYASPASACTRFDLRCSQALDSGNFALGFVCGLHRMKMMGERSQSECVRALETLDGAERGDWKKPK